MQQVLQATIPNDPSPLMDITQRPETVFVRGQGSWLFDSNGKKYLDFVQGWAVNCLGHSPEPLVSAITAQAGQLINCSPAYFNQPMLDLAAALTADAGLEQVFFANSGAEANEGAIKLARKWGQLHRDGAYEIITTEHAFHGRTLATMAASGKEGWDKLYPPNLPGFPKVPFGDLDAMAAAVTENTVAIMVEPIQGEAGVVNTVDDYMLGLRALTEKHGILLILDEIQTGMGRTGKMFACQHTGITPDIMTLGKGIGGGVPLAALLAKETVCCFAHGDQGGTFNGNPLMMAAGLAVWRELSKPGFLDAAIAAGAYLSQGLQTLSAKHGLGAVRGRGLLLALDLRAPTGGTIAAAALEEGLLLNAPRPDSLRFMPALNVSHGEIDHMLEILDTAIAK
ncbi:MAG: acetylornithine transaminase [Alphaproteobacteria bacterium]|jgi:acetylornithine/N-succinyldiaminopimelate aminotransferase|nr:acetylornithine transaminase [Alphaproteobacteria bacterium]